MTQMLVKRILETLCTFMDEAQPPAEGPKQPRDRGEEFAIYERIRSFVDRGMAAGQAAVETARADKYRFIISSDLVIQPSFVSQSPLEMDARVYYARKCDVCPVCFIALPHVNVNETTSLPVTQCCSNTICEHCAPHYIPAIGGTLLCPVCYSNGRPIALAKKAPNCTAPLAAHEVSSPRVADCARLPTGGVRAKRRHSSTGEDFGGKKFDDSPADNSGESEKTDEGAAQKV
jgi:hypothetical protein